MNRGLRSCIRSPSALSSLENLHRQGINHISRLPVPVPHHLHGRILHPYILPKSAIFELEHISIPKNKYWRIPKSLQMFLATAQIPSVCSRIYWWHTLSCGSQQAQCHPPTHSKSALELSVGFFRLHEFLSNFLMNVKKTWKIHVSALILSWMFSTVHQTLGSGKKK